MAIGTISSRTRSALMRQAPAPLTYQVMSFADGGALRRATSVVVMVETICAEERQRCARLRSCGFTGNSDHLL